MRADDFQLLFNLTIFVISRNMEIRGSKTSGMTKRRSNSIGHSFSATWLHNGDNGLVVSLPI